MSLLKSSMVHLVVIRLSCWKHFHALTLYLRVDALCVFGNNNWYGSTFYARFLDGHSDHNFTIHFALGHIQHHIHIRMLARLDNTVFE